MNFHLMAVHFPIALLTIYALLEIISIKRLQALPQWVFLKMFLVVIGVLSAFATMQTGELIEHEYSYVRRVVEVHALWAQVTTVIFSLLGSAYVISTISRHYPTIHPQRPAMRKIWTLLHRYALFVMQRYVCCVLAACGLIAITITGALGGSISSGPEVDPVVKLVYRVFIGPVQK